MTSDWMSHPKIPKYLRLAALLREQIQEGAFRPGDTLPSLRHLMREHRVTLVTVNKALDELRHEGWIESVQGCGTFVRQRSCRPVVGLVMPAQTDCPNSLVQTMIQAIQEAGWQPAYWPVQSQADVAVVQEQRFAGMFLLVSHEEQWGLFDQEWPTILLDTLPQGRRVASVRSDHQHGAHLVLQHLAEQGHHRILYLSVASSCLVQQQRTEQHRLAFEAQHDLTVIEQDATDLDRVVATLVDSPERCTAVFCSHDILAPQLLPYLKRSGHCVPRDMALIGYCNTDLAVRACPPLTSVDPQHTGLAKEAVTLLDSLMRGSRQGIDIQIPPTLVVRASTPPPLCTPHFP